ncbi:hypothetical protein BDW69DRAFT_199985 [Aspergillus filifer]
MSYLPSELWMHIALYLENDYLTLASCARVCRQWQPVFERPMYRNIKVESKDSKSRKEVVSLPRFRDLVSGKNQCRRSFIQCLGYTVVNPYELVDNRTVKREGYQDGDPIREANDQAIWSGMKSLFEHLRSWEKGPRFLLAPAVRGQDEALDQIQIEFNGEQVVGPYRARFLGGSMLHQVTRISNLEVEWTYESRLALEHLFLNMQNASRPDHLWYMRERRQAVASKLARLPSTLRVLKFEGGNEHPWSNTLPALGLRPANSKIDKFSTSLRLFSCNLRELTLSATTFGMDFFYPPDDNESIIMTAVPEHLPSDEEDFPDPATGDEIFESRWLQGDYEIVRDVMNAKYFHRLFISLGYAARRMPRLKTISTFVSTPLLNSDLAVAGATLLQHF